MIFYTLPFSNMDSLSEIIQNIDTNTDDVKKTPVSIDIIKMCVDFLNFNEVVAFRRVDKFTRSLVIGTNAWDRAAIIQERREKQGKRMVLFNQYLLSRAQADLFPVSKMFK